MVNYTKFFSDVALARKPSPIRVLTAIQAAAGPEMISLAGGQEWVEMNVLLEHQNIFWLFYSRIRAFFRSPVYPSRQMVRNIPYQTKWSPKVSRYKNLWKAWNQIFSTHLRKEFPNLQNVLSIYVTVIMEPQTSKVKLINAFLLAPKMVLKCCSVR